MPPQVNKALDMLHEAGYQAYVVGGSVRDIVMGRTPEDYDIATSAMPDRIKQVFADMTTVDTGIAHGTVTVVIDAMPLEITTYRVDKGYSDGRHPDGVSFTADLREDAARRDFTVNSMAYNREEGLIDYFGGIEDIEAGVIRCVGNPAARFKEDGLRIMRALRFSSVLGFSIDEGTYEAALQCKSMLSNISAERLREELCKYLCGKDVRKRLLADVDILAEVIPELLPMKGFDQKNDHHIYDVLEHTAAAVESAEARPALRLAALFHDIGKPRCFSEDEKGVGHFYGHAAVSVEMASEIMARLKFDNRTRDDVTALVKNHDLQIEMSERAIKRAMNKLTPRLFFEVLKLKRADNKAQNLRLYDRSRYYDELTAAAEKILKEEQCFSLRDLAVNGDDLLAAGITPGPEVGRLLNELLEMVIDGRLENTKADLMKRVGGRVGGR